MMHGQGRILVFKNEYLCWDPSEAHSSPNTLHCITMESVVRNLSVCSVDSMNDEQRLRKKPVCLEITMLASSSEACEPMRLHAKIQLANDSTLSIWKRRQGVYLIAFETWDNIKYLQISNVEGHVVAFGGLLLLPSLTHVRVDSRTMLMSLAHNSLWTNGEDTLHNIGVVAMTRHDDLNADVPSIELDGDSWFWDEVAPLSSWRACIERVLLTTMADKRELNEEQGLRTKRCEYLFRESLKVLHEMADRNDVRLS